MFEGRHRFAITSTTARRLHSPRYRQSSRSRSLRTAAVWVNDPTQPQIPQSESACARRDDKEGQDSTRGCGLRISLRVQRLTIEMVMLWESWWSSG